MIYPSVGKSVFILAFLFLSIIGRSQPVANFSATPLSGCAPLLINFQDLSTGSPTAWKWDLGNGTISFLQNPSVTYFNPGIYPVKLVVQNAQGKDSITRTSYIQIFAIPVSSFSVSAVTGCYPLNIHFTDQSIPGSGTISQWLWDFGDGTTSTQSNPNHTYTTAGNFSVSLRVINSNGCSKTLTRSQLIHINEGVHADFSNNAPNNCTAPVTINFNNLSTGSGPLQYAWNFGDGTLSTLQNPAHTYNSNGSYTVSLVVTNGTGCSDTISRAGHISVGNILPAFTVPDTLCAQCSYTFLNTSAPLPASVAWDFGDLTTSSQLSPVKAFSQPGIYAVKMLANFGSCRDSIVKSIVVIPRPVSDFTANPLSGCKAPHVVHFINNSAGSVAYKWFFGDGDSSLVSSPSHTYLATGIYTVTLVTTNASGCNDTLVIPGYINIALPVAAINNLPQEGCAPFPWSFTSSFTSAEPAGTYLWNFGDGSTSSLPSPTHVFDTGVFDIRLIITSANGCTDTVTAVAGIRAGLKPVPGFLADPRDACARTPIHFTDTSTGTINRWHWEFGDGSTSSQQNPTHEYNDTGYFTVRLIVYNNGCAVTIEYVNYIHINPPIAKFNILFDCNEPYKRVFTDASIGADTWHWEFGDGQSSNQPSPVHIYSTQGLFAVTLRVTNNRTGCEHTTSSEVQIADADASFMSADTSICRNTAALFHALGNASSIVSYEWDFGDGQAGQGRDASHIYISSGVYTVGLIITDLNGCRDTVTKARYINVFGPVAAFSSLTTTTCRESTVFFTDNSQSDGFNPINQWIWNYGDGISDTLSAGPFQHSYSISGIFTVGLEVVDSRGCRDVQLQQNFLTISRPVAAFSTTDTLTCPGKNIQFTNTSTGPGLQYSWNFGDGSSGTQQNPVHVYNVDGIYTVSLKITDPFGCKDSLIKNALIAVHTPVARFTVSDSVTTCPPLVVQFAHTSQYVDSMYWDFGDGNTSLVNGPVHIYNIPGVYTAKLVVKGHGGCMVVATKTIRVGGPYGSFSYGSLQGCKPLTVNFNATSSARTSFIWDFNDGITFSGNDSLVQHTYNIPGVYVPRMIVVDAGGCAVPIPGTDTIIVHGSSPAFSTSTNILCGPGPVQFTNTSVSSDEITGYAWNFGDGSTSTQISPIHTYTTEGNYYSSLKVYTRHGCVDSLSGNIPVKIARKPELQLSKSPDGCVPLEVSFRSNLVNADTSAIHYDWVFANGQMSNLPQPVTQQYASAGSFPVRVIATNSSGCADTSSLQVNAFAIPFVKASADTFICKGKAIQFTATGGNSYSWSPATGLSCTDCYNPFASPSSSGQYVVTGTSAQGCKNADTIKLNVVQPVKISISKADTICTGSSVMLNASGAVSYAWYPATGLDHSDRASVQATPKNTTIYRVIGEDEKKCFRDTGYIPVKVYPVPTVDAGSDATLNVGQTMDLVPVISTDVTIANWTPTGTVTRNSFPAITVQPRKTTTYHVEVRNPGGCTASDDITIHVICNGANVFIPNTFSPNRDGMNDVFYPRGSGLFSIKSLRIFNRWGEMVFQKNDFRANDPNAGWDGTYKGKDLNVDVFVYTMEVLCDNNTILPYQGNVALVR